MTCKHLKAVFDLCQAQGVKLASSDLIRIMCTECGTEEVCPSMLYDEYEAKHPDTPTPKDAPRRTPGPSHD